MSDKTSNYRVVIRCFGGETRSRFARLKTFLLSVISNILYRLRKRFSGIIFNGRPLCSDPDDDILPSTFRRLSHRKLKKIKDALKTVAGDDEYRCCGHVAPPPSICVDDKDLEIEIIPLRDEKEAADEEAPAKVEAVATDNHEETAAEEPARAHEEKKEKREEAKKEEEPRLVRKKLSRPKAAKGRRSEIVIPPYVIIDEEMTAPEGVMKKMRPKAAKGDRKVEVDHPIDLPAEVLLERYGGPDVKIRSRTRQRPTAPRPRPPREQSVETDVKNLDTEIDDLLNELRTITTGIAKPTVVKPADAKPAVAKPAIVIPTGINTTDVKKHDADDEKAARAAVKAEMTARRIAKATRREKKAKRAAKKMEVPVKVKVVEEEKEEGDEEEEDIFNVPYLPKSQRQHASSGLGLPWLR